MAVVPNSNHPHEMLPWPQRVYLLPDWRFAAVRDAPSDPESQEVCKLRLQRVRSVHR